MSDAVVPQPLGTRVLVAIEGPHEAVRLAVAAAGAVERGALVEVVHVGGLASDAAERAAWASVSDALARLRACGMEARGLICRTQPGGVAGELASRADELEADLVVVGCGLPVHGPVPPRWSVCRTILSISGRPVLIVPYGPARAPGAAPWVTVAEPRADLRAEAIDRLLGHPDRPEILVLPPARGRS